MMKTKKAIGQKELAKALAQAVYRSIYEDLNGFDDVAYRAAQSVGMKFNEKVFQKTLNDLINKLQGSEEGEG